MITVELPPELENRLEELAKETGRTKEFFIIEAVIEHLDDIEDLHIAEKRWNDILSGKSETIPIEEMLKRYGVDD